MADWRQIQARIRKAKNSPDAQSKLNELYQRTRDAMVAWELALIEEKAERNEEAGKWYTIAAQRFRRADWRKKAEEALTRLGIEIPPELTPVERAARPAAEPRVAAAESGDAGDDASSATEDESDDFAEETITLALGEIPESQDEGAPTGAAGASGVAADGSPLGKRKRRRGRRGGRGRRRKGGAAAAPGLPAQAFAGSPEIRPLQPRPEPPPAPAFERSAPERYASERRATERVTYEPPISAPSRSSYTEHATPQLPSERAAHGRGDPALASRMAHLESLLRRLVTSPLHRLEEAEEAPAGPGVFLLSDSDQITSYYVEACQTLRIGAGNLVRGGRSAKSNSRGGRGYASESGLKGRLAEYLGINEAKVSQYMKDHCVIRWIQLDDEAPLLAHFAIGVLRTPLNLE